MSSQDEGRGLPALDVVGISKAFGATRALSGASLRLFAGEVHALTGENGAGKSTLIKIVTGVYSPDAGEMLLEGRPITPRSAAESQRLGIGAIYQEPSIFPDLSVAENIFIGRQDLGMLVDIKRMHAEAAELLGRLDLDIDSRLPASRLSVAGQQAVEIAKAISLDVRVLIMDEPTAALSAHEVERLFRQVRHLQELGVAVLFITHRLEEVFTIADRVSVFRDGRHISTRPVGEVTEESLIREMVGRDPAEFFARSRRQADETVLAVESLGRTGAFSEVSFTLRAGEVLGMAGLVGAGRTDVALALFGIAPADSGRILRAGAPVSVRSPQEALGHGIAYLTEDRRRLGLSLPQSVTANITLATLARYTGRSGLLDTDAERDDAGTLRDRLGIVTPGLATPVSRLSGGNQQKTMLARWLNAGPDILILDEPTRGIDVAAKAEVHRFIDELARSGMAIILISSDLPEVLAMSDRVAVMRQGSLAALLPHHEATDERVMAAAVGAT